METDLSSHIAEIKTRSQMLVKRILDERRARQQAENRVEELSAECESLRRQLAESNRRVEYLKVTQLVNPTREDVDSSRRVLSDLVREIDKCIADLSEQTQ